MRNYAVMLEHGQGIPQDKKEAAKYYKMAADRGNAGSMKVYGRMLEKGDGIPQDKEAATKYYQMASTAKDSQLKPNESSNSFSLIMLESDDELF